MFITARFNRNVSPIIIQARHKSKIHWAASRKKNGPKHKALNHFDDFYGSVFGDKWEYMRAALLRSSKYVAVINNYGDPEETMEYLSGRGAHCLKKLMTVQEDFNKIYKPPVQERPKVESDQKLEDYVARVQSDDIANIYSNTEQKPERLDTADITLTTTEQKIKIEEKNKSKTNTLEQALAEAEIDKSRIIDPTFGLSPESLWQYIPATKLKGMDDWIPESLHYSYYSKGKDFPLLIEPEKEFSFPEHLKVFTYEMDSELSTFPEPKRSQTGVLNYYPMDGGSVLAVLALCLRGGDRVLDMCAAPGGKSLVALQTLLPDIVVSNDISLSRSNRLHRVFRDYLYDFDVSNKWRERVLLTNFNGLMYTDDQGFDKVLVDVPCTIDRVSVTEDENNIFRPDRIKERLKIPEIQSQLLAHALSLVKVGGAVVYSTCSLSPVQNDGVVHLGLKQAFEARGILATVKDLTSCMSSLSSCMELAEGAAAPRYGQLVTPRVGANFGPTYFARLVRTH